MTSQPPKSHHPPDYILRDSKDDAGRISYIKIAASHVKQYAHSGQTGRAFADLATDPRSQAQLETTRLLLTWLKDSVNINPNLKEEAFLELRLQLIQNPASQFPPDVQIQATNLLEEWEAQGWGGGMEEDDLGNVQCSDTGYTIHQPPTDHPIWGTEGIMHGLAKKEYHVSKLTYIVENPTYTSSKRDPKVYGHNGLTVGQWFPSQLSALFHGAHGFPQAGVYGSTDNGAYSIIVSESYSNLNRDQGKELHYSGAISQNVKGTHGTKCLKSSIDSANPVRVIRAVSRSSSFAPSAGMRYDGLYKVVEHDPKDGPYGRFKLVRDDDNNDGKTLDDCKRSPSAEERSAWEKRNEQYW